MKDAIIRALVYALSTDGWEVEAVNPGFSSENITNN